jgi:hypothetical protein
MGIISNAIASAGKHPMPQGQENISLLHQQASNRASPASSQFTFTFDSQVSGTVPWPGSESSLPHVDGNIPNQHMLAHGDPDDQYRTANARSTQYNQLTPSASHGGLTGASSSADGSGKGLPATNAQPKKHKRRGNPLLQAAKQRRQDQEYKNYTHPPAPDDVWICEFCEYERIFGRPPEALIRQYEIKDRRRRREEAERRRLLEKAKMKSRKGKKPGKLPAKNPAAQDRNTASSSGHQAPPMEHELSQETHSEDFEEDDYYEDDVHDENSIAVVPGQDFEAHSSATRGDVASGRDYDNRSSVT